MKLKQIYSADREDILFCMCSLPETDWVYCGSSDFQVHGLELAKGAQDTRQLPGHRSYVSSIVATTSGELVSAGWDRQLIWWEVESGQLVRQVAAHRKWIRHVAASPQGGVVASVADDMLCRLWDVQTGELIRELAGHDERTPHHFPSMLFTCEYSADGAVLATADKVGHVVVWNPESGEQLTTLDSPENYTWDPRQRRHSIGGARSLRFSPDGKRLAVGGVGHIDNIDGLRGAALIQVYDWQTGERIHKFEHSEENGLVECLQFTGDGRYLYAAGGNKKGFLLAMDLESGEFAHSESMPMHIHQFELDESRGRIKIVGHGAAGVWEIESHENSKTA